MDKSIPQISVIMPFRNAEKFLDQSIQSILNQTFTDFEFIIINDASTDASDRIVSKYLDDPRVVYLKNNKQLGTTKNLNKGLRLSKAFIIARMDGDDISILTRLEKQLKVLQNDKKISIVGSFAETIDEG